MLWFTNTPSLASAKFSARSYGGGWIESLESMLKKDTAIELGIGFFSNSPVSAFSEENVSYFPICNAASRVKQWYFRAVGSYPIGEDVESMLEIIRQFKPDIIHIHGTEFHFGLIYKYVRIPIVISIQGNISACIEKYFGSIPAFEYLKLLRLKDLYSFYNPIFSYRNFRKKSPNELEILENAKYIIGRTAWDNCIASVLAQKAEYFHVSEILRHPFYKARWEKSRLKSIVLTTTLSDAPYKGIELILKATILLKKRGIDFIWNIVGVNESSTVVKAALRHLDFEPSPSIVFHGQKNVDDLISVLLDSDVYVQVSHIENSANSLCEAMLLGMPCIASDTGGTSSIIEQNISGILFNSGDSMLLTKAIIHLRNNYELGVEMGARAREIAGLRHDPLLVIADTKKVYNHILENDRH